MARPILICFHSAYIVLVLSSVLILVLVVSLSIIL